MRLAILMVLCLPGCFGGLPDTSSKTRTKTNHRGTGDSQHPPTIGGTQANELKLQPVDSRLPMVEKRVLNGRVALLIPQDFQVMGQEMLNLKYRGRRPTLVFTDNRGLANIALNHTQDRMPMSGLPRFQKMMEAQLKPAAGAWFRSEMVTINGRHFVFFDFRSKAVDTQIRNVLVGTSCQGRLLLVTFNVVERLETQWLAAGNRAIMSIRVSD